MTLRVAMAQIDMLVGDIKKNCQMIIDIAIQARDEGAAKVVVFPELTLMGYPPEDLLLKPELASEIELALEEILEQVKGIYLVLGYPRHIDGALFNCAGVLFNGVLLAEYNKQKLPNDQVFDDTRYFDAGNEALVVDIDSIRVGLSISEDICHQQPIALAKEAGAQVVFNLNASPFHIEKMNVREALLHRRAIETGLPILYVNYMGAQDELVYDGGSFVVNNKGVKVYQAPWYQDGLYYIDLNSHPGITAQGDAVYLIEPIATGLLCPNLSVESHVYKTLVLGLTDYAQKNHFDGVLVGLREGVESALSLVIAVDAMGVDKVQAIIIPETLKNKESLSKLQAFAKTLGVKINIIKMASILTAFNESLTLQQGGKDDEQAKVRLDARVRTLALMTLANDLGYMAVSSTHKSDMAVGASCLYGDMAGCFAVLKDIFLSQVLQLCLYRNSISAIIPLPLIQNALLNKDSFKGLGIDALSSYAALDKILLLYIEQNSDLESIVELTKFEASTVFEVIRLVDSNEYKRRQAPLGVRVTKASFGRGRRYPISNGWYINKEGIN